MAKCKTCNHLVFRELVVSGQYKHMCSYDKKHFKSFREGYEECKCLDSEIII